MRVILLILVFVFTISAQDHFAEATRSASKGDYEKALATYKLAQNESKNSEAAARVHYNIGVCLYQLDRPAEAVTELIEAIRLRSGKYQRAWYALGMAETALGNTAKARDAFIKAVELNKKDAEAWFDLGLVLITEKDLTGARTAFGKAVEFGSVNSADAHNNLGVIHALEGNVATAIREFKISGSAEAIGNLKYCRDLNGTARARVVAWSK